MTTLNLSTVVPGEATQIVSRRATCQGRQDTIADTLGVHPVTIKNGCIGCSCGLDQHFLTCEHMRIVEEQEAAYAEEAPDVLRTPKSSTSTHGHTPVSLLVQADRG